MKIAFILLFILFLTNFPSLYYGWYLDYSWFDTVQHFCGGFLMAMFMYGYLKDRLIKREWVKNTLIIVGTTVFIGVLWEFSEFIANQTLIEPTKKYFGINAYFMGDLIDTVGDLLLDTLGALVFLIIHSLWSRDSHKA